MHIRTLRLSPRSIGGWNALGGALVLSWVGVLGAMVSNRAHPGNTVRLATSDLAGKIEGGQAWMGAYYRGAKIGYVHTAIQIQKERASVRQLSQLSLTVAGKTQSIRTVFALELVEGFRLESFSFTAETPLLPIAATGRMKGRMLEVNLSLGGESLSRAIPLAEPPAFDVTLPMLLASQPLRPQDRYEVWVFDPPSLSNRATQIEVIGPEAVAQQQEMVPAIHLRREMGPMQVDTWIDVRGNILKELYPFGLLLRREDERTAVALPPKNVPAPSLTDETESLLRMLTGNPASRSAGENAP